MYFISFPLEMAGDTKFSGSCFNRAHLSLQEQLVFL